jgi:hypothetical protein
LEEKPKFNGKNEESTETMKRLDSRPSTKTTEDVNKFGK